MYFDEALQDMRLALETMWSIYDTKDIISVEDRQQMEKLSFALDVMKTLTGMVEHEDATAYKDGMLVERSKWTQKLRDVYDGVEAGNPLRRADQLILLDSLFEWLDEREHEEFMWS